MHDHERRVGLLQDRRDGHRVGGKIEAGQILDLFLDHQLLGERLRLCGVGGREIAIDDLDRVIADLVAVGRHIGVDPGLEILALQGEWT